MSCHTLENTVFYGRDIFMLSESRVSEQCREVTPLDMEKAQASAAATDAGEGVFGGEVLPWFEGEGSVNCIRFRETGCAE